MFDKREYRMFKGVRKKELYPKVCDFWSRQGFYVGQISPFQIQGESYHQKIGLRREFFLRMEGLSILWKTKINTKKVMFTLNFFKIFN